DGVCLAELASLADPALLPLAVADALGVREMPGQPLIRTLIGFLERKHLLLILDNCEHLIDAAAQLAETLLHACPRLQVMATSRERLRVPGELVWRVPSLSQPNPEHLPPVTQ